MKKLMILSVLALTSCAPLLQTVQGEAGSLSRDGSAILLNKAQRQGRCRFAQ